LEDFVVLINRRECRENGGHDHPISTNVLDLDMPHCRFYEMCDAVRSIVILPGSGFGEYSGDGLEYDYRGERAVEIADDNEIINKW